MGKDVGGNLADLVVCENEGVQVAQPLEVSLGDDLDPVLLHLELLQIVENRKRLLRNRGEMVSAEIESLELPKTNGT